MIIYRMLLIVFTPLIIAHAVYKGIRLHSPGYIFQRLGFGFSGLPQHCHWLHCASVGEAITAIPLLDEIHKRDPAQKFIITTNTVTGAAVIERQMGTRDFLSHAFLPIDWCSAIERFLISTHPARLSIVETELWPNLIAICKQHNIKTVIVNGRLSARTTIRNRWVRSVYASTLAHIDSIFARNAEDASAFIQLGADPEKVSVLGNLKYAPPSLNLPEQNITARAYVIIASTHEDEEIQIAKRWLELERNELLVIAPRHPERSDGILKQLETLTPKIARRSRDQQVNAATVIYLLDSVGELMSWLGSAKLVVMGGSFVAVGGHNILEAAHFDKGVLFGPHMKNFSEESKYLLQQGAAIQCDSFHALQHQMQRLLADSVELHTLNHNARDAMRPFANVVNDYANKLE
jgi:3-deoxy-D-manno-octulosonic-acid transferase